MELDKAYREEELYWKQKSHESWHKEGNKNPKVFHGSVKYRRLKNHILVLLDEARLEQFLGGEKGNIDVDSFRNLF